MESEIKIRYEDMKFHYTYSHYDYHLAGTCWYNGKLAFYESLDETDYQTMNDTCPCCKPFTGSDDYNECHCENAPDVYCYIYELSLAKRLYYRLRPYYTLLWFIKKYGRQGYYYWKRWKY